MKAKDLGKCPVCGNRGRVIKITQRGKYYYIGTCRNKYCTSDIMTDYHDTPEQAAAEWNRMVGDERV